MKNFFQGLIRPIVHLVLTKVYSLLLLTACPEFYLNLGVLFYNITVKNGTKLIS